MQPLIIVLNGVPRSGKSSIAQAIPLADSRTWVGMGVDAMREGLAEELQPGIGLRPGGERPDLEPHVRRLFVDLYQEAAGAYDAGRSVVMDVGHHDSFSQPLGILKACAEVIGSRRAWLVGVRCPMDEIVKRRAATGTETDALRLLLWEEAVHTPGIYDVEVSTALLLPTEAAAVILRHAGRHAPRAFKLLQRG